MIPLKSPVITDRHGHNCRHVQDADEVLKNHQDIHPANLDFLCPISLAADLNREREGSIFIVMAIVMIDFSKYRIIYYYLYTWIYIYIYYTGVAMIL